MIDIGKIIYKVLDEADIVSYPIVAPENSKLPLVIYERSYNADDTKDARGINISFVDIYVLTEEYTQSITLSKTIEEIIISLDGVVEDTRVFKSKLIAGNEMWADGVYIQKMTFEVRTAA